jgi:hypothetical protein
MTMKALPPCDRTYPSDDFIDYICTEKVEIQGFIRFLCFQTAVGDNPILL